jgi:hypothetical protein
MTIGPPFIRPNSHCQINQGKISLFAFQKHSETTKMPLEENKKGLKGLLVFSQ